MLGLILLAGAACANASSSLLNVDFKAIVSRADLHYTEPASRSEESMPVGNGRVGSLVWTAPGQFQHAVPKRNPR